MKSERHTLNLTRKAEGKEVLTEEGFREFKIDEEFMEMNVNVGTKKKKKKK